MSSWLKEATVSIAKSSLSITPARSYDLLVLFPLEVWEIVIPNVPDEALGRLAASARFFRKIIDDERHWRRRLALQGLLELFESHPSRLIFPTWKEYYAAHYLASRKPYHPPPLPFVSEYMASLDAAPRVEFDGELLDQFSVNPANIREILVLQASKPYYPRYQWTLWEQSRGAHPGQEHCVFLLKSGELHAEYAVRPPNTESTLCRSFFSAQAQSFRELKSNYALHGAPCPFPFSYIDWHSHLLDCIRVADRQYPEHWQARSAEEHYYYVISRRRLMPRITVHYQLQSAKFEVKHRNSAGLLGEILNHFKVSKEYHTVTRKQLFLQNDLGVVFPERSIELADGQVWLLRPDKVSKRSSLGLQVP